MPSNESPEPSIGVATLARNHQFVPRYRSGARLVIELPAHDVTGRSQIERTTGPGTAEASRTSQCDVESSSVSTRKARPIMSGRAEGVPNAFDSRATTFAEGSGKPVPAGASRSITPSATTPSGWNIRRPRNADPHRKGALSDSIRLIRITFPLRSSRKLQRVCGVGPEAASGRPEFRTLFKRLIVKLLWVLPVRKAVPAAGDPLVF